jgi:hypothetical protein
MSSTKTPTKKTQPLSTVAILAMVAVATIAMLLVTGGH